MASISPENSFTQEFQGKTFFVQFGEFSDYLKDVNFYLSKALQYAANDNQRQMLAKYLEHFQTGSIPVHKDS